jgi:type IV pilus biogenesis protein CpaD/CtpE
MKSSLLTLLLALTLAGCGSDDAATTSKVPTDTGTSRYKQTLDHAQQSANQLETALSGSADRADEALKQAH